MAPGGQRSADGTGARNNKIRRKAAAADPDAMTAPQGRTFENRVKVVEQVTPADPAADGLQTVVPDFVIDTMARALLPALREFYDSPEGQEAFEAWKRQQAENT